MEKEGPGFFLVPECRLFYAKKRWAPGGVHRHHQKGIAMAIQRKIFERVLNMAQMHNIGVLHRGSSMVWTCRWNEAGKESSICYQIIKNAYDKSLKLRLRYKVLENDKDEEGIIQDFIVPIRVSLSYKRKVWYWFVCPLTVNGKQCGRRVRNLYFLPSSNYFGCKHCRDMMVRSLPVKDQFIFRQTRFLTMEDMAREQQAEETLPELQLGWRPSVTRRMCPHCGCLSEGMYCCHCAQPFDQSEIEDHFQVLGLADVKADPEAIHSAFKNRQKQYHPDRVAHLGDKIQVVAEREIKRINQAYEVLKDPEKRAAYVRELLINKRSEG